MAKKSLSGHDFRAPILINGDAGTSGQVLISQGNSNIPVWADSVSGGFVTSDTAPSNPSLGDMWFDTSIGTTFIYYDSYWVEVGANSSGIPGPAGANGADGAPGPAGEVTQTIRNVSTSTSLVTNDKNQMVVFSGSSPQTLTVDNILVPGSKTAVFQEGSGSVSFIAGNGVTLLSPLGFKTRSQYSKAEVTCINSGQYRLSGDLAGVSVISGGTLYSDSTYYYRVFSSSGSLIVSSAPASVDILVIGGGGSGGSRHAGGGGAGGVLAQSNRTVIVGSYAVAIGAGGAGITNGSASAGNQGSNTTFGLVTALGGGYGGGGTGGSGGGGTAAVGASATQLDSDGATGYGFAGGTASYGGQESTYTGGGGGGAGSVGGNSNPSGFLAGSEQAVGGAGGSGKNTWSSWATATSTGVSGYYAGGGGGGAAATSIAAGAAGSGGGGAGGKGTATASSGTANTGSGGGGSGFSGATNGSSGSGGSGIVIIRYTKESVGG